MPSAPTTPPPAQPYFNAADGLGIAAIALIAGAVFAFRQLEIVPRAMVGLCAAANAPAICAPRAAILWLQYEQLIGWAALLLGAAAFFRGLRPAAILAIAIGIAATINYNATTGIIGVALGLTAWIGLGTGRYEV
jgi:hypothetical protein